MYLFSTKPPVRHVITDCFGSRHGRGKLTGFDDCSTTLLYSLEISKREREREEGGRDERERRRKKGWRTLKQVT